MFQSFILSLLAARERCSMKKGSLVLFRVFVGDEMLPTYVGIIINHEIRIPINQPG